MLVFTDDYFMREALREAQAAALAGEVPVGAVLVCNGRIIGRWRNQTEQFADVTAHAEIIALSAASQHRGSKYLRDCTLYVTLEPCPMCAGALAWAQLGRLVFGAHDDKRGASLFRPALLHPKTIVQQGVLADECGALLTHFFEAKRK